MADSSKTEKATPKKRRDERKKGNVFMSKDAIAVATLFAGIAVVRVIFPSAVLRLREFLRYCFSLAASNTVQPVPVTLLPKMVMLVAQIAGPPLLVAVVVAVVATFAQTKMLVTAEVLKPKFNRISPLQGVKRLFSLRSVIEALKGLIKITILLVLIYSCLQDLLQISERYMYAELAGATQHLLETVFSMLVKVSVAFLVLAALDFMYQWWDYERQMKMTKQEIKEEYKQTEGDPQVKGKIKQIQRQMAQSRMMQQVPGADVVVRNPTHFAVALRYHNGEDAAPIVLAKGQDYLAQKIVSIAEENDIICIENVPLARALYAEAELNNQIPPDLYEPVAEVMVYLYKLGRLKGNKDIPAPETPEE